MLKLNTDHFLKFRCFDLFLLRVGIPTLVIVDPAGNVMNKDGCVVFFFLVSYYLSVNLNCSNGYFILLVFLFRQVIGSV